MKFLFKCPGNAGPRRVFEQDVAAARLLQLADLEEAAAALAAERGYDCSDWVPPELPVWGELGVVGAYPATVVKFFGTSDLWVHSLGGG